MLNVSLDIMKIIKTLIKWRKKTVNIMVSWWYWLVYLYTDHKISLIIQASAKNVSIMCFWTMNSASLSGIRKQLQKGVSWNLLEILSIFMYLVLVCLFPNNFMQTAEPMGSNFVFISKQFKLQVYVSVTHLNFRFLISLQPNVIDISNTENSLDQILEFLFLVSTHFLFQGFGNLSL